MYCPRCGTQNIETTKFCRQCGLSLTQVSSYIATGGTAQLMPSAAPSTPAPLSQFAQLIAGYSPRQKMWLTILCMIFLPGLAAVMGSPFDYFVPVLGVFMCVGIPWAVIHFRNQQRLLDQQQWQVQIQMQQMQPPLQSHYLQPPQQFAQQVPVQMPQPMQQPYAPQPVYQPPVAPQPPKPVDTNPLKPPASVIEDETRRLPGQ